METQLPYDCLEHIAHFADIDTRRAMGFPPRKLVVPELNIRIPDKKFNTTSSPFWVQFDDDILLYVWPQEHLLYETRWYIHGRTYSMIYKKEGFISSSPTCP